MKGLSYDDIGWVLRHLLTLRAGDWPDPEWSEPPPGRAKRFQARFVGPCELAADVELRLSFCGIDGFLVKQLYAWGESIDYLAGNLSLDRRVIGRGIAASLAYITGKWPKDRSYMEHKRHEKAKPKVSHR